MTKANNYIAVGFFISSIKIHDEDDNFSSSSECETAPVSNNKRESELKNDKARQFSLHIFP